MTSRINKACRICQIGVAGLVCVVVLLILSIPCMSQLEIQADPTLTTVISTGIYAGNYTVATTHGIAVDQDGNIFFSSFPNDAVWEWSQQYRSLTRAAGNQQSGYAGDGGPAFQAKLNSPYGVAVDNAGNLYIADEQNMRIRKVDTKGFITTVAGGGEYTGGYNGDNQSATSLRLCAPIRIALSGDGTLYISEECNNIVRKLVGGILTTVAGTPPAAPFLLGFKDNGENFGYDGDGGAATKAHLNKPTGIALDTSGNLYIADSGNYVIRKVSAATGTITTIAGKGKPGDSGNGGPATSAEVSPDGIAVDKAGNIFIAGYGVRRIDAVSGYISAVTEGAMDVAVDATGNLYLAVGNDGIRKVLFGTVGFGSQKVGIRGSSHPIKIANVGNSVVKIASVGISGTNAGDYSMVSSCGQNVAPKQTCVVDVTLKPSGIGERQASLVITQADNALQTTVHLSGLGSP
jgi:sugar lactone lactonase YvrE